MVASSQRVLSGMRPTGQLHLGHYHGVLKNWAKLQYEHDCFFFVADWHALTTAYEKVGRCIIVNIVLEEFDDIKSASNQNREY